MHPESPRGTGDLAPDLPEADDEEGLPGELLDRVVAPPVGGLVGEQTRQSFGEREQSEHRPLGQLLRMHAAGTGQRHSLDLVGAEPGPTQLLPGAGGGALDPAESRRRTHGSGEPLGGVTRHAEEDLGGADQLLPAPLVVVAAAEVRVAPMIGRVARWR